MDERTEVGTDGEEVKDADDAERDCNTVEDSPIADTARTHSYDESEEEDDNRDSVKDVPEVRKEDTNLLLHKVWLRCDDLEIKVN